MKQTITINMRLLIIILLFSFQANATTYYVSNTGSDAAAGTSTGTPWQTIAKVNASSFSSGDQILFKAGDSWNERLNVPASNLTFGAYGTGAKPLITGLQTLTGWTDTGGNIWKKYFPSGADSLNTVIIDGLLRPKGRYPNTGYLTLSSFSGSPNINQITGGLSGTPNYTGGQIGVRSTHFTFDVGRITSQSGGVINFSPGLTYDDTYGGNGYFIQNHLSTLDVAGEWCYSGDTLYVYATSSPNVQASTIDTLIHLDNKNYVTFDGISVTGANKAAFQLDTTNRVLITNTNINYCGAIGISALKSDSTTISYDSIQNCLSNGLYMRQVDPYTPGTNTCNYTTLSNSYIKNVGKYPGMGMNHQGRYMGSFIVGTQTTVINNRFDSIGYIAILFNGQNSLIKENYVTNYCSVLDDGAGIYTNIGVYHAPNYNDGSVIRKNIVGNSTGANAGTSDVSFAAGIYLDHNTKNITVDSNTAFNTPTSALFIHLSDSSTVTNNTLVNSIGNCFDLWGTDLETKAMNIKRNVFYSQSASYSVIKRFNGTLIGIIDSNFYSRPLSESSLFNLSGTTYNLAGWQSATGLDGNSVGTPTGITSATPLFYYNPTSSDSTISLTGEYKDSKSNVYNNSITLEPFTSAVLYRTTTPLPPASLRVKIRRVQNL